MSVAASEADTGTCMAEGLSGSQRAEAADGRVGRRRPGRITPGQVDQGEGHPRTRSAGRGSRGGLKQPSDRSVGGGATHRGAGQLRRLLPLHDLSRAAVSVPGQFCSSVVGLWPASVTRPPQGQAGHPAPGPAGAGRVHGGHGCAKEVRRHTSPLPPEEAKTDTLAPLATRRRFPGPGHSRPRSVEPAQSTADFMHERADGARTTLLFPKSVQPGEEDPSRLHAEDRDPAEMQARTSVPVYGATLPRGRPEDHGRGDRAAGAQSSRATACSGQRQLSPDRRRH